ncbi:MAG: hypothetical protein ACRYFU_19150 [Janthinobacterium lividum]
MSNPVHEVDGTSHTAKGKGVCKDGQCDFLLAVPVKSFDSGDTNRDLHMLQVTRGAQFPYVTVRLHLPEAALASPSLLCNIEVQFAGQTAHYSHVRFQQSMEGKSHHITGSVPATADPSFPMEAQIVHVPLEARIKREMQSPPFQPGEQVYEAGAQIYVKQCASCHGVPGYDVSFAKWMFPKAPQLWKKHGNGVVGVSDDEVDETYWK